MTGARARRLTVAAIAAAVAVALAGVGLSMWANAVDHKSLLSASLDCAIAVAFTVAGAVVAGARPGNAIGWLMLAGGVSWALGSAGNDLGYRGIVAAPGSVPAASAWTVAGATLQSVGWYLVTVAVPVVFPTGRLAGPRWRWLKPATIVIVIAGAMDPITDIKADRTNFGAWHNPIGLHGPWRAVSAVAFLAHVPFSVVVTIAAIAQLVTRWRRGDAFERQQLNLFAAAVAVPIVAAPIALGVGAGGWIFGATAVFLPITIGFAVLARGLYDLRTAANRSLVWVTLSAAVAGVFALVIVGLAALVHVNRSTGWLLWVAAAVVAVVIAPLRDSLQRAVNRVTFGRWDQPYDVLAALGQRVEAAGEVERLLGDVATELEGLGLQNVLIADGSGTVLVGEPESDGDPVEMQLTAYGDHVGRLSYLPPATPLRARDRQLLEDLAGHLGGVLYAHRLTLDLQRAREQLVLAREEERRRLRRDLHDGLGPALAGHLLRLDVIAAGIKDPAATSDLNSLRAELRETMNEVRRVVEGLRPPALDELGLVGSLQQVASRLTSGTSTRVVIATGEMPALPAAVEVAVFRIVTEAVTNVVKHAGATTCRVELSARHGRLRIAVVDDGERPVTSLTSTTGHGLQTMRERAEELRGRLTIAAGEAGTGMTVVADIPLPSAPRQRFRHEAARVGS